jgi:integrase
VFFAIVRLLVLTGQRGGEVAGMIWKEISDDLSTWNMPGERTKNGVPHVVPVPTRADRTSTAAMRANQLRLWFASMACVGLHDTDFATATCGTIRLKLLKIGAILRVSVRRTCCARAVQRHGRQWRPCPTSCY